MSAGAKVTIAVVILFTVLLGVYYGFGGRARPDGESGLLPEPEVVASPATKAQGPERTAVTPPRGGILSEGVARSREVQDGDSRPVPAGFLGHDARVPGAPPTTPAAPLLAGQEPVSPTVRTPDPGHGTQSQTQWQGAPAVQPLGFNEPRATPGAEKAGRGPDAAPVGSELYTVEEDDSMWTIAADSLGQGARWPEIARLNPQINPHRLDVGQKIVVPSRRAASAATPGPAASAARDDRGKAGWVGNGLEYSVKAGDTLSTIAKAYFGEAAKWQAIYDANKAVIGGDPGRLKIGMKLRIPGR